MKINKLKKIIEKNYLKNGQQLYTTSIEVMDGKTDCALDIYICTEKGELLYYLFEVTNYNAFYEEYFIHNYFKDIYCKSHWDGCQASYMPLYLDRIFYLKKFETITEEDIINCTKYFVKKILNMFLIWNIKFIKGE